jgi:hypothetical protein
MVGVHDAMVGVDEAMVGVDDAMVRVGDGSAESAVPDAATLLSIGFLGDPGVYDENALSAFLAGYPAQVTRVADPSPLTPGVLAAFDVVVLDQLPHVFDASEAATLASWVHAGGALLSLTGFANTTTDADLPNSLLADLPMNYGSTFVALTPAPGFVTSFATSPATSGLHNVPFWGGHQITLRATCDGPTQAVAFLEGGPVGAICNHGAGRVYLWGDEWVEYSREWTSATDAQAFWQAAIDWLAGARVHPG